MPKKILPASRVAIPYVSYFSRHFPDHISQISFRLSTVFTLPPDHPPPQDLESLTNTTISAQRGPPDCHPPQPWKPVGEAPLVDGINYLRRIKGDIRVPARHCGRVSCSWAAGIFVCNDVSFSLVPPLLISVHHFLALF